MPSQFVATTRTPWWFAAIFGGPGLIVEAVAWWFIGTQHYRLATYVPVQAHIEQSHVVAHEGSNSTTYAPVIVYTYREPDRQSVERGPEATNQGASHTSNRVCAVGNFSSSGSWAYDVCSQYRVGASVTAWVSPKDPKSAFLSRQAQWLPHGIALFGSVFVAVGAWMLFSNIYGFRSPKPPTPGRDGWFVLHEEGSIGSRFRSYAVITLIWYGFLAAVIGDYVAVDGYRFDLFSMIAAGAGGALGIIGLVQSWRCWQLCHDFLNAEMSSNCQRFLLGETIELRLRQSVLRPLEIEELSLGAVCIRNDRIKSGTSVAYTPAKESRSVWKKLEINRGYPAGGEVTGAATITLPHDADRSSPPRSSTYPIFRWFMVLHLAAEGEPKLNVYYPIMVEGR